MSATDELRRMLDELGVEWQAPASFDGTARYDTTAGGYWFHEFDGKITIHGLTPEQAIAATLGADDTYTREDVEGAFVSGYSLGLDMFDNSKPDNDKGWNQNERDMDEEMEELGWVRKDAATLGRGECHDEGTFRSWGYFTCSNCKVVVPVEAVREAPSIGKVVPISFCPNCGRKVVDK